MLTEFDEYLFHEGKHSSCYKFMGAHMRIENHKQGVRFTVWAPNAKDVFVVGDFSNWTEDKNFKLKKITKNGVWSIFVPRLKNDTLYKFGIKTKEGKFLLKSDPYARYSELRPSTASVIVPSSKYKWNDKEWKKGKVKNLYKSAMNIYEMHFGSWKTFDGKFLNYKEVARELPSYLNKMGYTHVEIMPITEHPFDKSWGYQSTGFYSPTSRYGSPDDLRYLIDKLHQKNIGVILDWVPGHFCNDEHGLAKFDGEAVYEYAEEWKAHNKGWGASNFDLGRPEVKSFLLSNATYWIKEFHIDGLRVDAVSNMVYLDYGREEGEWIPDESTGNINKYSIEFLKELNTYVKEKFPNVIICAEESTTLNNVTKSVEDDGIGFDFKWNLGWMNDSLKYMKLDPIYRKYNHNLMTFSMMYNYSERFILPLSHDEVVHGKKSILDKMFGDYWTKFASLRLYYLFMIGHPGKKLSFMGMEFGQFIEWRDDEQLDWSLPEQYEMHGKLQNYVEVINKFYLKNNSLWELDYNSEGFEWIDADNGEQSIYSFVRRGSHKNDILVFILNFTPLTYEEYKIGVPFNKGCYEVMNTDDISFGGSGQINNKMLKVKKGEYHNQKNYVELRIPPMGGIILSCKKGEF